ncbi:MAG: hypothetical protein JNK63_10620 [Chthonomonas sp.]|nr:hypothetical protein [Chthonomonas sp.]
MNSTRISLLAMATAACSFAAAQWYPNSVLSGTTVVSSVASLSIYDLASVNGVPIVLGGNATATGYSGPVGTFRTIGTDLTSRSYVKGLNSIGINTSTSYSQSQSISWDGNKVSVGMLLQTLDGSVRPSLATYDYTSDLVTPFGNLGYYTSSAPFLAASGYTMSGDGNTVGGQAYWKLANSGTASTATNVIPTIATSSAIQSLIPTTNNNGRVQCINFDGTAAGGYAVGSGDARIWRKVAGVWDTGTVVTGTVGTSAAISLGAPTACDATGRYFAGGGIFVSPDQLPYVLDTVTGKATAIEAPPPPPPTLGVAWRGNVSGISSYGDIVYGVFQTFASLYVDVFTGFLWTPTSGMQTMDQFMDAQWPGLRHPDLHINNFGNIAMSPDGDWASCTTFSFNTANVASTLALVHLGTPVRGTMTLNDFVGNKMSKTMSWTLLDNSNNAVETLSGKLDDQGRWVWIVKTDISTGTWKVQADGGQFLKNTATFSYATKNNVNFAMVNGDPDYSGEVDAADIDLVILHFGETPSSSGWNADVDLDGSDEVDASDIDVAIANFGAVDQ